MKILLLNNVSLGSYQHCVSRFLRTVSTKFVSCSWLSLKMGLNLYSKLVLYFILLLRAARRAVNGLRSQHFTCGSNF